MSNNNTDEDCVDELCEATEGLNAFCEAITDDGKRKRCISIMDLLKGGKMDTDTAREKLAEELGKDGYTEGATGLRNWITKWGKEEPQIEEPEPIEEVEPIVLDVPEIPISLEISPIEPITEKEIEELDESISEPESEPLPEVEKVPEEQPEPGQSPSDDSEQPESEQSEE